MRTGRRKWEWGDRVFHQPFTLFRAKIQRPWSIRNPTHGFDAVTAPGGITVCDVPGMHEYMFLEPHLFTLIPELEDWVDRVTAELPPVSRVPEVAPVSEATAASEGASAGA